jgi:glyoxylase I family protein
MGLWGVRYQVKDVSRSIAFYTQQLGFKLDHQHLPAFGQVSIGDLKLILSGPGASGSRPLPGGREQEPGGSNRVILQVNDLSTRIEKLKKAGLRFRNELEAGPGGKQYKSRIPTAIRLSCSSLPDKRTRVVFTMCGWSTIRSKRHMRPVFSPFGRHYSLSLY